MAVGVFPAVKLGVLFLKQISKPLAKVLVEQAKNHPVFRTYFIIPPAQFYHWAEVKAKMYLMNLGKPTKVAKLNEQMAIELGANLMGEIIIFSVATGCLILEWNRQTTKEAKKEAARQAQLDEFTENLQTLIESTAKQQVEIVFLKTVVEDLAKKSKLNIEKLKPVDPPVVDTNNNSKEEASSSSNKQSETVRNATENVSVVNRAIEYYEKDVKGNNKN